MSMKSALKITALLFAACICFSGCSNDSADIKDEGMVFTDALGHSVTVDKPEKVAALSGSLAELWLLSGGKLAAVTSDAYDEHLFEVPENAANVGMMKSPSVEQMIALDIDFVLLSSEIIEHAALYDVLSDSGITTAYFDVECSDDYLSALKICTDITGKNELYEENGIAVQEKINAVIAKSAEREKPSVLYIRAFSSGAKAKGSNSLAGGMLADLGCVNIADSSQSLLEDLSIEEIIRLDPDYIFVTTMGSDEEKAIAALKSGIQSSPAWSELSAVKNGRYIVLPKNLFHYKPNARWGESYEMLAEILYGE